MGVMMMPAATDAAHTQRSVRFASGGVGMPPPPSAGMSAGLPHAYLPPGGSAGGGFPQHMTQPVGMGLPRRRTASAGMLSA